MAAHKELITSGKFDEKFKRALLDYYNYGFKRLDFFDETKRQTLTEDWQRLNRVIADYVEWSENRNEVMFATVDSQSMGENPFHRVYRFCKYKPFSYPSYFLHTIAALSELFELRNGVDSLDLDETQRMHLEDMIEQQKDLTTSDLTCFYTEKFVSFDSDSKNKTPNNRLDDLARLGLVLCKQKDSAKNKKSRNGNRHWSLPGLTMKKILEYGNKSNVDFERHLCSALDFFSKYYIFGEVGTLLLDRIGNHSVSPFRFKHEYFMQAINDFNIVDLLYAIEHKKWCKIKYSHGITGSKTELLCYPLEIRISNMQGREFLMCYEPFRRSYTGLRIEFIDSIEFYDDKKIKQILSQMEVPVFPETVNSDIVNARVSLQHSWGVSTTKKREGNAIDIVPLHPVTFRIAHSPETEFYIENRLNRECRFGIVAKDDDESYLRYGVYVSDEVEMRPWIRSFYSRIMDCKGMDTDEFSVEEDIKNIVALLLRDELPVPPKKKKTGQFSKWDIPEAAKAALGSGTKAREHDMLFNEVFSVYYYLMADVFVQLCSSEDDIACTETEIDHIIRNAFNKYYLKIGQATEEILPSEIKKVFLEGVFLQKTSRVINGEYETVKNPNGIGYKRIPKKEEAYICKYKCAPDIELYRDIVPLSVFELRWLKTIIEDNKLRLFLSESEIDVLRTLLDESELDIKRLPVMDEDKVVKYFDRFRFLEDKLEQRILGTILEGIYSHKILHIKYHTMKHKIKIGYFQPIILEFSKRNNRFQGFFLECDSNRIYTMNISHIKTAIITDEEFDYDSAEQALIDFREKNTTSVEVEFYNVRNIADRILTEFSSWKKRCSYDVRSELYRLTIFYQKQDEVDLVIRLLGYGANLRFIDRKHPIFKEIQSRMNRQMELLLERRMSGTERELGDNR